MDKQNREEKQYKNDCAHSPNEKKTHNTHPMEKKEKKIPTVIISIMLLCRVKEHITANLLLFFLAPALFIMFSSNIL